MNDDRLFGGDPRQRFQRALELRAQSQFVFRTPRVWEATRYTSAAEGEAITAVKRDNRELITQIGERSDAAAAAHTYLLDSAAGGWYGAANGCILIISGTQGTAKSDKTLRDDKWSSLFYGVDCPFYWTSFSIQRAALAFASGFAQEAWRHPTLGQAMTLVCNLSPEHDPGSSTRSPARIRRGFTHLRRAIRALNPAFVLFADPYLFYNSRGELLGKLDGEYAADQAASERLKSNLKGNARKQWSGPLRELNYLKHASVGIWHEIPAMVPPIKANRRSLPGHRWSDFWLQSLGAFAGRWVARRD